MGKYYISINQLADFSVATKSSKRRIIKQQVTPNKLLIPWYQLSKSRIKKYFKEHFDSTTIQEGIKILKDKKPISTRQITDRRVSIEALERFILIRLPKALENIEYTIIKPHKKTIIVNSVEIIVAPEIVIRGKFKSGIYKGKNVLGAIKIHISKTHPFELKQTQYVATTIFDYLQKEVVEKDDIVLPQLCLCLDVFRGQYIAADNTSNKFIKK